MPSAPNYTREEELSGRQTTTLRQVALSVRLGQRVTAFVPHGVEDRVIGYLAGWDPERWFILQPEADGVRQKLVNRVDTPVLEIHMERTYDTEPLRPEMEAVIVHFRTWINQNVLRRRS